VDASKACFWHHKAKCELCVLCASWLRRNPVAERFMELAAAAAFALRMSRFAN